MDQQAGADFQDRRGTDIEDAADADKVQAMNRREFIATAIFVTFQPIGIRAEDSQFIDRMKWCEDEVVRTFSGPIKSSTAEVREEIEFG